MLLWLLRVDDRMPRLLASLRLELLVEHLRCMGHAVWRVLRLRLDQRRMCHLDLWNLPKLMVLLWKKTIHSLAEVGYRLLLAIHELLALLLLQLALQKNLYQLLIRDLLLKLLWSDICLIW